MTWKPSPGMSSRQIERELNRQVTLFEEECRNGLASVQGSMKLADFCPKYLEIQKGRLSPRTWSDYQKEINKTVIPAFGNMKLKDIRPAHVQAFVEQLQGNVKKRRSGEPDAASPKLAPASVKRKLAVLQSILKQAVKLELIPYNPADAKRLTLPKNQTPKVVIFTKQEAAEMLS